MTDRLLNAADDAAGGAKTTITIGMMVGVMIMMVVHMVMIVY